MRRLTLCLALFVTGVSMIPAAHSALLGMIEAVLGTLWAWLLFGERPATLALAGLAPDNALNRKRS